MRENAGSPRVRFTNFRDKTLWRGVGLCVSTDYDLIPVCIFMPRSDKTAPENVSKK